MTVLSFSSSFPSRWDPTAGVFVLRRLAAVGERVPLEVVHPVPVWPVVGRLVARGRLPSAETIDGLRVHHRPFAYLPGLLKRWDGRFYAAGLAGWLGSYCRERRPTLLDAHFIWPDGVGVARLARRLALPYTITLRGTILPRYGLGCFRERIAGALRGAAAVISLNRRMAEIAVELGAEPAGVHLIPNGVDADRFAPAPRPAARQQLGLSEDARLVVSVASLRPVKGHEDLLAALARLPADVRLVVIGRKMHRGVYLRRLKALAVELGVARRVRFAGVVPPETVAAFLNAADVSVLASHSEGCPNVVLESLACGTPVVATAVGDVGEVIRPGETGLIVPAGAPADLAEAIAAVLERPWSPETIRASVIDRSWASVAERVAGVFSDVAAAG